MSDTIELESHDPEWHEWYEAEGLQLLEVLGEVTHDLAHVGSTAVPGLVARPIVDIMIGVAPLEAASRCVVEMQQRGYTYLGESGLEGRFYFQTRGERSFDVSIVQHHGEHWRRHLLFRDYLRNHPETADAYGDLKRRLVEAEAFERYEEEKRDFIERVLDHIDGNVPLEH